MKLNLDPLRVRDGEDVRLAHRPTRIPPPYDSRSDYRVLLKGRVGAIAKLQRALYAERRSALLVVLQGLDAGGKDGIVRHVFSGVNPQGCRVHSFGPPNDQELRHDFLWRTTLVLPERGMIGVFNRSYYEEVLAVRVHPDLLERQGSGGGDGGGVWARRFDAIRGHELHLTASGTRVLKIFLHLSKEEQRQRFLRRIARPDKHWKLDPADIDDRAHWDDYVGAYEACLAATSTDQAPWHVVPADDKKTARLLVAQAVLDGLQGLNPIFPRTPDELSRSLEQLRTRLETEAPDRRLGT